MKENNEDTIALSVEDEVFHAKKNILCTYSDYFKAMFCGNYIENDKCEIKINMVDADSMRLILTYMENGLIDLTELPLQVISDLAVSANFLQIVELLKQIEYTLETQLSLSNWIQIMETAAASAFPNLEKTAALFGLLSFDDMKVEYIPNFEKLFWYLSHSYLNAEESHVFIFGLQWITRNKISVDASLVILGCLDIFSLSMENLNEMKISLKGFELSLAAAIIECLHEILKRNGKISASYLMDNKSELLTLFSESVYKETLHLLSENRRRTQSLVPVVSAAAAAAAAARGGSEWRLYRGAPSGLEPWAAGGPWGAPGGGPGGGGGGALWGWGAAGWGGRRLVVAGGEYGRGSGHFLQQVLVYDTLRAEWSRRWGAVVGARRHAGLLVRGNCLYLVGGVGQFRIVLSSVLEVELETGAYRRLPDLPEAIQSPGVCAHRGRVYVAGARSLYRLEEAERGERWTVVLSLTMRPSSLVSHAEHIYLAQSVYPALWRWRPGDAQLTQCANFSNPVAALCSTGKRLLAFTQEMCGSWPEGVLSLEEYKEPADVTIVWSDASSQLKVNEVVACCPLVMELPPIAPPTSAFARKYLSRFIDTTDRTFCEDVR